MAFKLIIASDDNPFKLVIIDVSQHQGKIDWAKAKPHIDGAIIRIGYGDDIKSQDDTYAKYNMSECERLGIPYAVYIYSYAANDKQNKSEIEHTKRVVGNYTPLSFWLDLEERSLVKNWEAAAKAWVDAFGEKAGIYTWQEYFTSTLSKVKSLRWICRYGTNSGKPELKYRPTIPMTGWQYTSKAHIAGINGYVDVSVFYEWGEVQTAKDKQKAKKCIVTKKMVAAEIMKHLCIHSGHGYTQDMVGRQGDGNEVIDIYGKKFPIKNGDRDCSSAVISSYEAAGISCGGATYTGNMKERMVASGNFKWHGMSFIAQCGDTYLNEDNHTAMCLSAEPDVLMEFSINEKGKALGGKVGDQKQKGEYDETYGRGESHLRMYYDYPWDGILECVNNEIAFVIDENGKIIEDCLKSSEEKGDVIMKDTQAKNKDTKESNLNKSDNDLAIEVLFGVHGSGDKRKSSLGVRYSQVQKDVDFFWSHPSNLIAGIKSYIKMHGADALVK